jgi:hypothetical protein
MLINVLKEKQMFIPREQFMETETFKFCAFASDLGISPSDWAKLGDFETNLGNGMKMSLMSKDGEVAKFFQNCGCVWVTIFND